MAIQSSNKKVYFIPNRCLGCQECLSACAKAHPVDSEPRNFVMRIGFFPFPLRCAQCADASCMASCPKEAITRNEAGTVLINYDKCISCGNCMVACPYGMIHQHPITNKPVKCDGCTERMAQKISEKPACVENCALSALVYATPEEIQSLKEKKASLKVMNMDDMITAVIIPKEA